MTISRATAVRIAFAISLPTCIAIGCTSARSPFDRLDVRVESSDASTDSASADGDAPRGSVGRGPSGSRCGDGVVTSDERCDTAIAAGRNGACPTRCEHGNDACNPRMLRGDDCATRCEAVRIMERRAGDGCCPNGASAADDRDCNAGCGNGVLEPGETCDPPNSCPLCPISSACLRVTATGTAGTCNVTCNSTEITDCNSGDGCCPSGCTWSNDGDCSSRCGDGVIDDKAGETCEKMGNQVCPASCDDGDPCTDDVRSGSDANCNVTCNHTTIMPRPGDSCCPPGANSSVDSDCQPACGNNVVEASEECDDGNATAGDGCGATCALEVGTQFCMAISGFSSPCIRCLCDECDDGCYRRNDPVATDQCNAIATCVRQADCDLVACYCGSSNVSECLSGAPNGPCKAVIEAAVGTSDVVRIVEEFSDNDSPVGRALRVINCEQNECVPECRRR